MPSLSAEVRKHCFEEVALGYSEETALLEADRCLNCKNMPCVSGCPVNIKIPAFIAKIREKDYDGAYAVISESSSLPAVCGRVCPQESQCEAKCVRGIKGEPVGIGRLERFVADRANAKEETEIKVPEKNGKKVAVMDLDFRKPKIHKIFKTANTFGIVEYILGECSFEELVKKTEYGVDVFNRGKATSNASVIFMGENFKALLEKLKCDYDVILFDCPPVLQVSDYIHLAKLSSGVLFVVSCEKARRSQVKEAVSALEKAGANVMGSAVTFSGKGGLGKNYGAYYKNYKKYYGDYEGE